MSKKNSPNVDLHYHGGNGQLTPENGKELPDTGKKKKEKKVYN